VTEVTCAPAVSRTSTNSALAWAVFLGCSWTWVIGMFLPVLLVRDYGIWAWFVFAIPNVIGAAAVGWTVRDPAHSQQMVRAHYAACTAFSFVTIAFHVFFLGWLLAPWLTVGTLAPGLFIAGFAYATLRAGMGVELIAILTYGFSLLMAAVFYRTGGMGIVGDRPWAFHRAVLWLAPVCVLGFALNPYLDLTFHAVRQRAQSRRTSRVAFGVGFGGVFFSMIVFTLFYSGALWSAIGAGDVPASNAPIWFVLGHILFQACYTIGLHTASATARFAPRIWIAWGAAVLIGIAAAMWARHEAVTHSLIADEFIYRLFMAAYGLVFPAYVWLCILPSWRDPQSPPRRAIVVFTIVVIVAAPMFWMAFIASHMVWLVPGLLVILAGRFLLPRPIIPPAKA
jgi:uncharacterized membrane protein YiaA